MPFAAASVLFCPMALAACTASKARTQGEVVVVFTTDMVVPLDVDTIAWAVTVVGDERPFMTGSYKLTTPLDLPATLAVVSGEKTSGPVSIRLDALHDGASRVDREARLVVPAEGTKALSMPLNWLCSRDADPSLSCAAGTTCQAGQCVDSQIDSPRLPDYLAPDGGACFHVTSCFGLPPTPGTFLVVDPTTQQCSITNTTSFGGEGVNVGLLVNTAASGNAGACVQGLGCLIPLDHDSPEGWQTLVDDAGVPRGIALPPAVCRDRTSIAGVMIQKTSESCPTKSIGSPPCAATPTCLLSKGVCPSDWPTAYWAGYSCSAGAKPSDSNPQLFGSCAPTWTIGDAGASIANDRWCCVAGQQPPSSDPLLIDDMSGGPLVKIKPPAGASPGIWHTGGDQANEPLVPPPSGIFTYTPVSPPVTPDGGPTIRSAACMSSSGFSGTIALLGFDFAYQVAFGSPAPFDVTPYSGISFWARSPNVAKIGVDFPDQNTTASGPSATCRNPDAGGSCGDNFSVRNLVLSNSWAKYCVQWTQLKQQGFGAPFAGGLDKQHVLSAFFSVFGQPPKTTPPFEVCVSQIKFMGADAGACGN